MRDELRRQPGHLCCTEPVQFGTAKVGLNDQRRYFDSLTYRAHLAEIIRPTGQQQDRAAKIPLSPVMESHGNLQHPLIKAADFTLGADPEIFEGFVTFEPV